MTPGAGRPAVWRTVRRASLGTALLVAAWLVLGPTGGAPGGAGPTAAPAPRLREVWPAARVVDSPGRLADGADYLPALYVDADTSVGTAALPDRSAQRVVLRGPGGERELRRVDAARSPQFFGFTRAGGALFWAESTTATGQVETRLWRAPLDGGGAPALLTADTGAATFFGSEHDLVVADGSVHWAAAAKGDGRSAAGTEIRSVPVDGGPVTVRRVDGEYQLSAWPWLRSVASWQGPLELRNPQTGARITVGASATERVACSPTWCRSVVTAGSDGTTLFEMMRPDGSDRRRVGGATVSAATPDVARLDRFEPLLETSGDTARRRLTLYDIRDDRTVLVADGVGLVLAGQSLLWWQQDSRWHALDLGSLA